MQDLLSQFVGWESQQVQAREWPSPHRIHVTESVCRSNLTEESWIVGGWSDKVSRSDYRLGIVELIDSSVVTRFKTDQQIWISLLRQGREQILQPDRVEFGRSAAGFREAGQRRFLKETFQLCHLWFF